MKYKVWLFLVLTAASCSSREKGTALEKGSENYQIAMIFIEKVPEFNPDDNMVVLATKDFEITVGDVIDRMRSQFGNQLEPLAQNPRSSLIRLYKELAQAVAYSKIIGQEAAAMGIEVSEADIDSILHIQYERAGGEDKYLSFLFANGATVESLRRDIRNSETESRYFEKRRMQEDPLRESEIDSVMNGDRFATLRHILLMFTSEQDSSKKALYTQMESILAKAKGGEDFATLARQYSEDPGSKNNGGLIEAERGQLVPPFEKVAFTIPVGEISEIVETQYGYHILKVIDRKKEDRPRDVLANVLKDKRQRLSREKIYDQLARDHNFKFTEMPAN